MARITPWDGRPARQVLVTGVGKRVGGPQAWSRSAAAGRRAPPSPSPAASATPHRTSRRRARQGRVGDAARCGGRPAGDGSPGAFRQTARPLESADGSTEPTAVPAASKNSSAPSRWSGKTNPQTGRTCSPVSSSGVGGAAGSASTKRSISRPGAVKRGGAAMTSARPGTASVRAFCAAAGLAGRPGPESSRSTTCPKESTSRRRTGRKTPAITPTASGSGAGGGGSVIPTS